MATAWPTTSQARSSSSPARAVGSVRRRRGGSRRSALGAVVVLGARRVDRIAALADELTQAGGQTLAVQTDVTRREQVEALVAAAVERFGRIDVMINNAGLMPHLPLDRLKVDDWDRMIDVNIKGGL